MNKSGASSNRNIIFVGLMLGSILAGMAQGFWWLVGARAVQDLGMGALQTLSQTIIGDIISPEAITVMLRDEQGSGARAIGSHAAIVAREYGIPAVMGTGEGTHKLSDGEHVRVDGDRGLVFATAVPTTECEEQPG